MTLDFSEFSEVLEDTENGFRIRDDCPKDIRERLLKINEEYEKCMGETLFLT